MPECRVDGETIWWDGYPVGTLGHRNISQGILTDFREALEDLVLLEELDELRLKVAQLEAELDAARANE